VLVAVEPTHLLTDCEALERVCVSDGLSIELWLNINRTADAGFKLKELSADTGYLGASNMLASTGDPLHFVQDHFGSRFTRQLWPKVRIMNSDVSLLRFESRSVLTALSQAFKHD
jgi:hypothetical protein